MGLGAIIQYAFFLDRLQVGFWHSAIQSACITLRKHPSLTGTGVVGCIIFLCPVATVFEAFRIVLPKLTVLFDGRHCLCF